MFNVTIWVLIDFFVFLVLLCFTSSGFRYRKNGVKIDLKSKYRTLILILILLFCIYNKTEGDYFHYKEILEEETSSSIHDSHLEMPYNLIISLIGNNYFLFRFIIWGASLFFISRIFSVLKINNDNSWFCFIVFSLIAFAYVRASMGISLFYLGYTICLYKKSVIIKLLGLLLLILSLFFHKSIMFLIAVGIIAPLIRLNIITILLSLIAFPLIVRFLNESVLGIFFAFQDLKGIGYLAQESVGMGLAGNLRLVFIITGVVLSLYSFYYLKKKDKNSTLKTDRIYFNFVYLLFYGSFILMFFNFGMVEFVSRIREMAYIPLTICVSNNINKLMFIPQKVFLGILIVLLGDFYYFAYMYHLKTLGLGI